MSELTPLSAVESTSAVHPKVKAAAAGAVVGTAAAEGAVWCLDEAFYNGAASPAVPQLLVSLVFLVVPAALSFGFGWLKKSTGLDAEAIVEDVLDGQD